MRLTSHTDYSLKVLMYLNQQKRLVTLNQISEDLGISKNNLIKVSNQLAKLNFIETSRGRVGGLAIKEETGKISLKDIITKTEDIFFLPGCYSGQKCECIFLPTCSLRKSLAEALQAFLSSLAETNLNDVTPPKNKPTSNDMKELL